MGAFLKQWRALLGLGGIFLLGCIAGGLVDRALVARRVQQFLDNGPEMVTHVLQRRLTYDLSLDAGQQDKLHLILSDASQKVETLRKQIHPQVRDIILDAQHQTEAILRPDQLDRFHESLERAKKRLGGLPFFSDADADSTTNAPPSATDTPPPAP